MTDLAATLRSRVENGEGYFLTKESMDWFEACYLGDHEPHDPAVSPLYADLAGVAPGPRPHRRVRPAARRGRGLRRGSGDGRASPWSTTATRR